MGIQQMLLGAGVPLSASQVGTASYNKIGGTRPDTGNATATIIATGGSGSYTYSWAHISGSSVPTINSATSASPTWTATATVNNQSYDAVWRCTVSDGSSTVTVDVAVSFNWSA